MGRHAGTITEVSNPKDRPVLRHRVCLCAVFLSAWLVCGCSDSKQHNEPITGIDPSCEGHSAVEYAPAWSPDGEFVAYNHITTCGTYYVEGVDGIYVIRADGTDRRLLVPFGWDPDWSPDGSQIAYSYGAATCTYHLETDSVGVIFSSLGLHWPDWSPDGNKIALARVTCCPWGVCVSNRITRIKTWLGPGLEPDWSPDGSELVCCYAGVCIVSSDGSSRRQVTSNNPRTPTTLSPHWRPDGSSIIFEREWKVWIVDTDGSNLRSLGDGRSPAWSPDGELIVFAWHSEIGADTVSQRIWLMNADGTNRHQLTFPDTTKTLTPVGQPPIFIKY